MLPIPILIQMGLVSAAVQYAMDKYIDNCELKVGETTNTQNPQTPVEGQSLLGKTCIENRRRILSLMEEQKKQAPNDGYKTLDDKHKLLKEECTTNKDNISSLTVDLGRKNNALIDSIAAFSTKADSIYRTNLNGIRVAEDRAKNHHRIMKTHIKNTLDRIKFTYGGDSLTTKDIEKELTIMEEVLQNVKRKNNEPSSYPT